jgi:hypothetical protein
MADLNDCMAEGMLMQVGPGVGLVVHMGRLLRLLPGRSGSGAS